jgi:Na+/melibiose symporter-like transporter
LVCYTIGALIFSRFSLNEAEYEKIREELDSRQASGGAGANEQV